MTETLYFILTFIVLCLFIYLLVVLFKPDLFE